MEKETNKHPEGDSDILKFQKFSHQLKSQVVLHHYEIEYQKLRGQLETILEGTFETTKQLPERVIRDTPRKSAKEIRSLLKKWLEDHEENPYPNESEKLELEFETGLTRSQIDNC